MKEYKFEGILKRGRVMTRILASIDGKFWTLKIPSPQAKTVKAEGVIRTEEVATEATDTQVNYIKNQGKNLVHKEAKPKDIQLVNVKLVAILNCGSTNDRILVDYEGKYYTCLRATELDNSPNKDVQVDKGGLVEATPAQIEKGTEKLLTGFAKAVKKSTDEAGYDGL
jgi:hypothetical protein